MLPGLVDCGFHIVRQDYELRWPVVVMRAKTHDVDFSHSGRDIAKKLGESKGVEAGEMAGLQT